MGLKILLISVFVFCETLTFSQQDSIAKNEYITTFPDKITTRISLINTSNSFFINESDTNLKYELEPNIRAYLGASVLFRSIEIDYGFAPNFIKSNKDNADSRLFNLNLRMFQNHWMQTIDLYSQKGFNIILGNQKAYVPGVKTLKIGGTTSYILNENFSFRAIGFQNEWQTKSTGSFIPKLSYYYTKYTIKSDDINGVADSFDIALSPSYYYNFCLTRNLIFSLGTSVGIGLNHSSNVGDGDITSALFEFSGRAVVGYNSNTFFGGINSNLLVLHHNIDRYTKQDDTIPFFEIYLGYRFKAPKKWVKFADNFNKKYGF